MPLRVRASSAALGSIRRLAALGGPSAILTDIVVWLVATELAALARFDFNADQVRWQLVTATAFLLAAGQLVISAVVMHYGGRYVVGSFDEMRAIAVSVTAESVVATAVVLIARPVGVPRSLPFLIWPLTLMGMAAIRFAKRLIRQTQRRPADDSERILVFGAGWVGSALIQRMLRDPASPFTPVGLIDDDRSKQKLSVYGVRVLGPLDELPSIAARLEVRRLVIAINNADAAFLRRVTDLAEEAGLSCLVLPALSDTLRAAQIQLSTLREVNVQDVIGRRPVDTDVRAIAEYITNKRVLVTGAGGSIGSELCRQLYKFGPAELVMLDRDESALHAVELSIYGRALLESAELVLADIRDEHAVEQVFHDHQPQVVFHAAALKHLTLLERFPYEALRTNVYGTVNVLRAAARHEVDRFVNISTDKAANPVSALGNSKRLAEQVTAWFADQATDGRYLSVRFGNVLGSRGSVLHSFAAQIEAGGPVTVTDPDVTRFFMTIPEACQLVIQAGAIGRRAEALVLDMGEPMKIVDVAQRMISMSGKPVEIVFTGLRPGEKLHERLFGSDEVGERPLHPMISHVPVVRMDPQAVDSDPWAALALSRQAAAVTRLRSCVVG